MIRNILSRNRVYRYHVLYQYRRLDNGYGLGRKRALLGEARWDTPRHRYVVSQFRWKRRPYCCTVREAYMTRILT